MLEKAINHKNGSEEDIRQRLLESAEVLFSKKGFDATSVRDITSLAGCNVAAVNYHFQSKENLYNELFRRLMKEISGIRVKSIEETMAGQRGQVSLYNLLRQFSQAFLDPILDSERGERIIVLFSWEILRPRISDSMLHEEIIQPILGRFITALQEFCPELTVKQAQRCIHSLIGQLLHVVRVKKTFVNSGKLEEFNFDTRELIEHMVFFTEAGIRRYRDEKGAVNG